MAAKFAPDAIDPGEPLVAQVQRSPARADGSSNASVSGLLNTAMLEAPAAAGCLRGLFSTRYDPASDGHRHEELEIQSYSATDPMISTMSSR